MSADFNRLDVDIGQLKCSLEFIGLQVGFSFDKTLLNIVSVYLVVI